MHNESILNRIPRFGVIGFATNSNYATLNFLQRPAKQFNFHIKDFSISQKLSLEEKIELSNSTKIQTQNLDIMSNEERGKILTQYN